MRNRKTSNTNFNIMKRFIFSMLAPLAILAIVATGCDNTDETARNGNKFNSERIASLEEQIKNMEKTIASLEDALSTSNKELKAELEAQIQALQDALDSITGGNDSDIASLIKRLEAVEASVSANHKELSDKLAEITSKLNDKLDEAQVKALIGEAAAELKGEIAGMEAELTACQEAIAGLASSISVMQMQIDAMQLVLGSKVDNATFESFVQQTNDQMQTTGALLSELLNLCNGFGSGTTIKGYIDAAIENLTSMLDGYVLKSAYQDFINEYGKTKDDLQSQIDGNKTKITELETLVETLKGMIEDGGNGSLNDLSALTQKIADLTTRIETLEKNTVTLEQMQAQFNKDNAAFLDGVNGILADALENDGVINKAIAKSAEELRKEYTEMINDLESRVRALEGQVADLIDRIQSLVYVPKTSDGKIHIGTTYIAETDENGNDTSARIDVTPTKKLEYRVSPANLRDKLLELPLDCFAFYQEHVTRSNTEGSGMDEFHIVKIEEGNGPGEILVTVHNEHDFTHEDLAVALCIKHTSSNGIVTEFTSPYTTVIGEGRNIRDRFYLAKKFNDGWVVSRNDNISYLIRYNDLTSTVTLSGSEYEVVYDNGESVMTLEEAKERFEWDIDLKYSTESIPGAYSNSLQQGTYTVTPTTPNVDRTKPVTVKLSQQMMSNMRAKVSDKYRVSLSDSETTITLIPEVSVTLTVIGTAYTVDNSQITWNYSTWYNSRANGNTQYQTAYSKVYSAATSSDRENLSYIPEADFNEIFSRDAEWTVTYANGEASTIQGTLKAFSGAPQYDGNKRNVQFTVNGYVYSDGDETITLSRTVKPSSLVGTQGIDLTSTVTVSAPMARTADIKQTAASTSSMAYIFHFTLSDNVTAKEKLMTYTNEEVTKFFNGSKGSVGAMLSLGSTNKHEGWKSADGTYTLPVEGEYGRNDDTGSILVVHSLVAFPTKITPELSTTGSTVFNAPEDYYWVVPNGPKFPITGTVTVNKD